jgi:hypothetical protein
VVVTGGVVVVVAGGVVTVTGGVVTTTGGVVTVTGGVVTTTGGVVLVTGGVVFFAGGVVFAVPVGLLVGDAEVAAAVVPRSPTAGSSVADPVPAVELADEPVLCADCDAVWVGAVVLRARSEDVGPLAEMRTATMATTPMAAAPMPANRTLRDPGRRGPGRPSALL